MNDVEQLLGLPDSVANLTDEQLIAHLEKFFPHTRPKKPISPVLKRGQNAMAEAMSGKSALTNAAAEQAAKLADMFRKAGIDPVTRQPIVPKRTGPIVTMRDLKNK